MLKYNYDLAILQTCSNCQYCQKGAFCYGSYRRCNNPISDARRKWFCDGHESPCADHVENPTKECCAHWLFY